MATYEIGFVSNNWFKEVHGKPAYVEDGFCEHRLDLKRCRENLRRRNLSSSNRDLVGF